MQNSNAVTPSPTLVIAEAGVNHNGRLDLAMQLIDAAAHAGADLVKFQTFSAEQLVTTSAAMAEYQAANTGSSSTQLEMLRDLELGRKDHEMLIAHCEARGIGFFSTAFDVDSLNLLYSLGAKRFKVPSAEITNFPYLVHDCAPHWAHEDGRQVRPKSVKGALGNALHAVLCGAGHNIRLLLKRLRILFAQIWQELIAALFAKTQPLQAA